MPQKTRAPRTELLRKQNISLQNEGEDRFSKPTSEVSVSPALLQGVRKGQVNPATLQPSQILSLQRSLGNQAVQRLLKPTAPTPAASFRVQRLMTSEELDSSGAGRPSKKAIKNNSSYNQIFQALDTYHTTLKNSESTLGNKGIGLVDVLNQKVTHLTNLKGLVEAFTGKHKGLSKRNRRNALNRLKTEIDTEISSLRNELRESMDVMASKSKLAAISGTIGETNKWSEKYNQNELTLTTNQEEEQQKDNTRKNLMGSVLRGHETDVISTYITSASAEYLMGVVEPAVGQAIRTAHVPEVPKGEEAPEPNEQLVAGLYNGLVANLFSDEALGAIPDEVCQQVAIAADNILQKTGNQVVAFNVLSSLILLRVVNPYINTMFRGTPGAKIALRLTVLLQYQANRIIEMSKQIGQQPHFMQALQQNAGQVKQFMLQIYQKGGGAKLEELGSVPALVTKDRNNEHVIH